MPAAPVASASEEQEAIARASVADIGEDAWEQGSLGFFEWIGATNAAELIKDSPNESVVGSYQDLSDLAAEDSAFNLDNMKKSLSIMEECNDLREKDGLDALQVDPWLVAAGQIDANYSAGRYEQSRVLAHAQVYNMGENLAIGGSPFVLWYDNEKAIWESDKCTQARADYVDFLELYGVNALSQLHKKYPDVFPDVGHYLNIVYPQYQYTGAGYVGSLSQQSFGFRLQSGSTGYSVDEFISLFNQYYAVASQGAPDPDDPEPDPGVDPDQPNQAHAITVVQPANGTVSVDASSAKQGDNVSVTVVPDEGYTVKGIKLQLSGSGYYATYGSGKYWGFTMPDCDVSVTAILEKASYSISTSSQHCSVSLSAQQASVGDIVRVTPKADEGWRVDDVTVSTADGKSVKVSKQASYWSFEMPASNVTVTVKTSAIEKNAHQVKVTCGSHVSATAVPSQAKEGETVTVTTKPDAGYEVTSFSPRQYIDGMPVGLNYKQVGENTWTFTMPDADATVVVLAGKDVDYQFSIQANQPEHGTLALDRATAKSGETVTVKVSADKGWNVSSLRVRSTDGGVAAYATKRSDDTWSFKMPAEDVVVDAVMSQQEDQEYKISVFRHMLVDVIPSVETAHAGETVTLTVRPADGYRVTGVRVGPESGDVYPEVTQLDDVTWAFEMPSSNVTVSATTVWDAPFAVQLEQPEHGTITASSSNAKYGEGVTVTVQAEEGWEPSSVTVVDVDGTRVTTERTGESAWTFSMPASAVTVSAELSSVDADETWSCDGGASCPTHDFVDVDHAEWYHESVDWAYTQGIMTGYTEVAVPTFGPSNSLMRAEMAQILYNIAGNPAANSSIAAAFHDVDMNEWYVPAIAWAVESGMFTGFSPTTFRPGDAITREQLAVVLWRAEGEPSGGASLSSFPDGRTVSEWAEEGVEWAVGEGLLRGYDDTGLLEPTGTLDRAEAATVLMRWMTSENE